MKKTLTFIPLGIGISAAIIYVFNVIQFKVINNSATLLQILANLKVYLYVSIAGFLIYFLIKLLDVLSAKKTSALKDGTFDTEEFEPFEPVTNKGQNEVYNSVHEEKNSDIQKLYVPNYDYVPMYQENQQKVNFEEINNTKVNQSKSIAQAEEMEDKKITFAEKKYCYKCGENIHNKDKYCSFCGTFQGKRKNKVNPILKNIINVLEIVILILIVYFLLNMLFDYKESHDPNFTSPFKVSMTK